MEAVCVVSVAKSCVQQSAILLPTHVFEQIDTSPQQSNNPLATGAHELAQMLDAKPNMVADPNVPGGALH